MTRPLCVHCNTHYGTRSKISVPLTWKKGMPRPAYKGNGKVVFATAHLTLNEIAVALAGRPQTPDDQFISLKVWDGESWHGGYKPFCTLICALDYARKAYHKDKARRIQATPV